MGVCLVIDDVHHLTATAEGERSDRGSSPALRSSVHFVLAGRTAGSRSRSPQGAGRGRRRSANATSPSTTSECRALADAHGADAARRRRLGADGRRSPPSPRRYGITGATDYVWEAVLDRLDREQRRIVATAASDRPCDPRAPARRRR